MELQNQKTSYLDMVVFVVHVMAFGKKVSFCNFGRCSTFTTELWGAYYACQMAVQMNISHLIIELDSQALVNALINEDYAMSSNHILMKKVRQLLHLNWTVQVRHTYKEGNQCAD